MFGRHVAMFGRGSSACCHQLSHRDKRQMGAITDKWRLMIIHFKWDFDGISWNYSLDIPSGNVKIANWKMTIEIVDIFPLKMVIFHSYFKLPEGIFCCIIGIYQHLKSKIQYRGV